jgi:hypothetical protein
VTSPESFFIAGRAYVTGAHAIVKSDARARYDNDFRFVIPCMMLIGHAIEVYLKAWLTLRGYTDEALRKRPFGHNLRKLYEEARINGLPEPGMPPRQSFHDLVESYEIHHGDFSFRYPVDGWTFEVPKIDIVFQIFAVLDRTIATAMGIAVPANLDWSMNPDEDFRLPPAQA